jgi:hypothetical protein
MAIENWAKLSYKEVKAAKKEQVRTIYESNKKKYADQVGELEEYIDRLVVADTAEEKKENYRAIAEVAFRISNTTFRNDEIKRLCKEKLGDSSIFNRINTYIAMTENGGSPIIYDEDTYQIHYKNGVTGGSTVIAEDFLIYISCYLKDEDLNTRWVLEIKQRGKDIETLEVSNAEFGSAKKLKEIFLSKKLSLIISESQMDYLRSFLIKLNPIEGKKITRLGYDEDIDAYIFANGIYWKDKFIPPNENGLIVLGDIAVSVPVVDKNTADKHWFKYIEPTEDTITFEVWLYHFLNAHTIEIGSMAICHYFMTIYRDIIFKYKKASPILFLKGPRGSGKTSILLNIMSLFGLKPEDNYINVAGAKSVSSPAISRIFSKFVNAPLLIDEYSADHEIEGDLQGTYDGKGRVKAKVKNGAYDTGLDVDSPPVKASGMVSTNFIPTKMPFFSRCIYIPVTKNKVREQSRQDSYKILEQYEESGLSHFTAMFQKHRKLIKSKLQKTFDEVKKRLEYVVNNKDVDDRLFINQALVIAPFMIVNRVEKFAHFSEDISRYEDLLINMAAKQIQHQYNQMNGRSALAKFWEIMQRLKSDAKLVENFDYGFISDKLGIYDDGYLVIRFPLLWGKFEHYYRQTYHESPPDRKTIEDEISILLNVDSEKIYKDEAFFTPTSRKDKEGDDFGQKDKPVKVRYKNSIRFPYKQLVDTYGIDFGLYNYSLKVES